MLKKNQPVKFAKPMSTMRQVLSAVEHGFEQKAKWDELGGSRWAKRMLDEATPLRFNPSFKTEAPKAPQADSLAPVDVYPDNPLYY